jgi:hypothetical protein
VLTSTVMLVAVLSTLINYDGIEALVIRIRYRNLRYAVLIPTKEDQEISMGRALNDALFVCRMIKEFSLHNDEPAHCLISNVEPPPPTCLEYAI